MSSTEFAPQGLRVRVQRFGTFLSNMVLPNIGAFIAWGLITALFIETGWITLVGDKIFDYHGGYGFVEELGGWGSGADGTGIVGPMITYLLPLLIGYTGGRMAYGGDNIRGGVVGAIATMGAVTGADVPMFLGAMVMGPLGGYTMRRLDALWANRIRPGFEMLVNNFSAGIWGMILAIFGFAVAGPFVKGFSNVAENVVDFLVDNDLLPLTSIFVEPAKVLFLNNAINHGVFTPLGTSQAVEDSKSILFLIEANPGPGLGLLLAFMFFGKGMAKASASGAAVIHFLGGIHEIYFPYVLMKPRLILALIAGGATGVATNLVFDSGLRAPAAPGSIIAVWLQAPASSLLGVTLSVILSAGVCFAVAAVLLRLDRTEEGDLAAATASMEGMKGKRSVASSVLAAGSAGPISSIVFACDAGMGSSAMGASVLRRKVQAAGHVDVSIVNKAISDLNDSYDVVVTHQDLTDRARQRTPSAVHVSVDNFMGSPRYDEIVAMLDRSSQPAPATAPAGGSAGAADPGAPADVLTDAAVVLGGTARTRDEAIDEAGRLLVAVEAVDHAYVAAMHERETSVSTHMGNGLAIPHGTNEAKSLIRRTAISFVRYDDPVDWNGRPAEFVVGIAGAGDDHLALLQQLAGAFVDADAVARLRAAASAEDVRSVLGGLHV